MLGRHDERRGDDRGRGRDVEGGMRISASADNVTLDSSPNRSEKIEELNL